jgi:hypothetical protein
MGHFLKFIFEIITLANPRQAHGADFWQIAPQIIRQLG